MGHRLDLDRATARPSETTQVWSSHAGIARLSYCCSYEDIRLLSTCGGLGRSLRDTRLQLAGMLIDGYSCVFAEMFVGKPILAGSSDLNQIQMIFDLVGSPTEETMPGWSHLPGCEGIREFRPRPSTLAQRFRE